MKFYVLRGDPDGVVIRVRNEQGDIYFWARGSFPAPVAEMVRAHIEHEMEEKIWQIREAAYLAGWSDAKAKKARLDKFYGCLNGAPESVGYRSSR